MQYLGKISRNEELALGTDYLTITGDSRYSGYRFSAGAGMPTIQHCILCCSYHARYLSAVQDRTVKTGRWHYLFRYRAIYLFRGLSCR
jgi:hypothetical protein